jgi:hypothetical protein
MIGARTARPYLGTTRVTQSTGYAQTLDVATALADHVAWPADNPRRRSTHA